jgi:Uma2 family endonuclease
MAISARPVMADELRERPDDGRLVVGVRSPEDRPGAVAEQVAMGRAYGGRMVAAVDAGRRHAVVHRPGQPSEALAGVDTLDGGDVAPGWTLPVAELFAGMAPMPAAGHGLRTRR